MSGAADGVMTYVGRTCVIRPSAASTPNALPPAASSAANSPVPPPPMWPCATAAAPQSTAGNKGLQRQNSRVRIKDANEASFKSTKSEDETFEERSKSRSFALEFNQQSRVLRSQNTVHSLLSLQTVKSRLNQTPSHRERNRVDFVEDVDRTRAILKNLHRYTINPNGRFVRHWDFATLAALLFTIFITPWEVSFLPPLQNDGPYARPITFVTNRVVDAIFIFDVVISFFLPYRAHPKSGGMWVYEHKRIAAHYLRGWFAIDAVTCIPFDVIFGAAAEAHSWEVNSLTFRLLRMLRVLKLMRIIRASRIFSRWQDHISLSFAYASLIRFLLMTLVLAHWLACLWGFIGLEEGNESDDWGDAGQPLWEGYLARQSWKYKARVLEAGPWETYAMALYVALNNIFGGSCEINPANFVEFYAQCIMLLIGSSVWAYVIGSACGVIATLDPALIEYRQTMDELNYFVRDQSMPAELTVKLRGYFRNTMHVIRSRRYEQLLQKMSSRLRGDAAYRMSGRIFAQVPYLVHPDLEPEFMCSLAIKYSITVNSRLERVSCTNLFVVEHGVVAKRGRLGLAGACFGKDVILSNNNLRDLGDAIALTFVQTISLTQKDIFELLPDFPNAYTVVRRAALGMALVRALVRAADIVKKSKLSLESSSLSVVFDRALELNARFEAKARASDMYDAFVGAGSQAGSPERRSSVNAVEIDADGHVLSESDQPQAPRLFPEFRKPNGAAAWKSTASRLLTKDPKRSQLGGALGASLKKPVTLEERLTELENTSSVRHADVTKRLATLETSVRESVDAFNRGLRALEAQRLQGHVEGADRRGGGGGASGGGGMLGSNELPERSHSLRRPGGFGAASDEDKIDAATADVRAATAGMGVPMENARNGSFSAVGELGTEALQRRKRRANGARPKQRYGRLARENTSTTCTDSAQSAPNSCSFNEERSEMREADDATSDEQHPRSSPFDA